MDDICLMFTDKAKLVKDDIDVTVTNVIKRGTKKVILIGKGPLTPICEKHISFLQGTMQIEYFEDNDLVVNITEHELVPLHVVLSDDEKKELLKR